MITFATEMYDRLQGELHSIQQTTDSIIRKAEQSYQLCYRYLKELKHYMQSYTFNGPEEEIHFFKHIKPNFLRELLLQLKIFEAESHKPALSTELLEKYYEDLRARQFAYLDKNKMLFLYHKLDKAHLDEKMFTREAGHVLLLPQYDLEGDSSFSNTYSFKLAKIQAAEDFAHWLLVQLHRKNAPEEEKITDTDGAPAVVWRGTQAQFYEWLLGALKTGALGNISFKAAVEWMGSCLGIRFEHYYRHLQALRIRKKSRTPYLTKCITAVIGWMDEADEHPQYH